MDTIEAYYTFVDRFSNSRYAKPAETIFVRAKKELEQFN